jgi:hypothetical protein
MSDTHLVRGIFAACMAVAILVVFLHLIAGYKEPTRDQLMPSAAPIAATSSVSAGSTPGQPEPDSAPTNGWATYENSRYHYSLSYPPDAQIGSDIVGIGLTQSEVIYLSLDPRGDPTFVCAANNVHSWSSKDILDQWVKDPPLLPYASARKSGYGKCMARDAGPPLPNVRSTTSSVTISGLSAYEVTNIIDQRFEAVCDYFATAKTILAACLPPQGMTDPRWKQNLMVYREVLSSLKIGP